MKNYREFINENNSVVISLADVDRIIKKVFDETKVSSVSSVYETDEESGNLKLVITVNNLFYEETDILHTKFVFFVDDNKHKLLENKMYYLYDINCNYKEVNFDGLENFELKLFKIVNERDFGNDIKNLSDINITIALELNKWLEENDVEDISIYSVTYHPILDNIPCKSLSFKFDINIDDSRSIELRIKKNKDNDFKFTFKENDWFHDVEVTNIKAMVQTIGETIKNHIK